MNKSIIILAVIIAVGVAAFFVFQPALDQRIEERGAGTSAPDSGVTSEEENSVLAVAQKPGRLVTVSSVVLGVNGYVVIHETSDGAPGAILGNSQMLPPGEHSLVDVALPRIADAGEMLFAMLHQDNGDGAFDASDDQPILDGEGDIILMQFPIDETAELPLD